MQTLPVSKVLFPMLHSTSSHHSRVERWVLPHRDKYWLPHCFFLLYYLVFKWDYWLGSGKILNSGCSDTSITKWDRLVWEEMDRGDYSAPEEQKHDKPQVPNLCSSNTFLQNWPIISCSISSKDNLYVVQSANIENCLLNAYNNEDEPNIKMKILRSLSRGKEPLFWEFLNHNKQWQDTSIYIMRIVPV